jgi:hypothetical protein
VSGAGERKRVALLKVYTSRRSGGNRRESSATRRAGPGQEWARAERQSIGPVDCRSIMRELRGRSVRGGRRPGRRGTGLRSAGWRRRVLLPGRRRRIQRSLRRILRGLTRHVRNLLSFERSLHGALRSFAILRERFVASRTRGEDTACLRIDWLRRRGSQEFTAAYPDPHF